MLDVGRDGSEVIKDEQMNGKTGMRRTWSNGEAARGAEKRADCCVYYSSDGAQVLLGTLLIQVAVAVEQSRPWLTTRQV